MNELSLHDALLARGFAPRFPHTRNGMRPGVGPEWCRYYRSELSRRMVWLEGRPWARLDGLIDLDHREDWSHRGLLVRGSALVTWHVHTPSAVWLGPGDAPAMPVPWGWGQPSWYWPGATAGLLWSPAVDHLVRDLPITLGPRS